MHNDEDNHNQDNLESMKTEMIGLLIKEEIAKIRAELNKNKETQREFTRNINLEIKKINTLIRKQFKKKGGNFKSWLPIILTAVIISVSILNWFKSTDDFHTKEILDYQNRISKLEKDIEFLNEKLNPSIAKEVVINDRNVKIKRKTQDINEEIELENFKSIVTNPETDQELLETDIQVISDDYIWKCGSDTTLNNGKLDKLMSSLPKESLQISKRIIAVGTASNEGQETKEDKKAQEKLAINRAYILRQKLRNRMKDFNPKVPVSSFIFGQNTKPGGSCDETINQRRVIIVSIRHASEDILRALEDQELKEPENALKTSFLGAWKSGLSFPININDYSFYKNGERMLVD